MRRRKMEREIKEAGELTHVLHVGVSCCCGAYGSFR